jgi:F-type H+-transporting ATPase subunit gamma
MGASIRELRDRIGSVKNTKKITTAMKLVAAAKVRRAQDNALKSRPFSEELEKLLGGLVAQVQTQGLDIPLLEERPVKSIALVVVTGDRGLCGGYNSNMLKKTERRIKELQAQGIDVQVVLIGNKGITYFNKRDIPVMYSEAQGTPSAGQAEGVAEKLLASFYAGEIDRVELLYTKFISLIASEPTVRTLIPLLPTGMEMEGDELIKLSTEDGELIAEREKRDAAAPKDFAKDAIFEQPPSDLINALLPLYLNGQILRSMQEGLASELAARMQAMSAATDNAKELQSNLEVQMNRARQAAITQEIAEICAGAAAR